jgi:hypothetical protein
MIVKAGEAVLDFIIGHYPGIILALVIIAIVTAGVYGAHQIRQRCEESRLAFLECIDADRAVEYCDAFTKYDQCHN